MAGAAWCPGLGCLSAPAVRGALAESPPGNTLGRCVSAAVAACQATLPSFTPGTQAAAARR
jgi:hypothetical protein